MKIDVNKGLIAILFFLLVFQSALERVSNIFSYIDESIIVLGLFFMIKYKDKTRRIFKKQSNRRILIALIIFLFCGRCSEFSVIGRTATRK